jgi:hypothetical protein
MFCPSVNGIYLACLICRCFSFRHCSKVHLDVAADQHGSLWLALGGLSQGIPGLSRQLAFAVPLKITTQIAVTNVR